LFASEVVAKSCSEAARRLELVATSGSRLDLEFTMLFAHFRGVFDDRAKVL
jgi:hypothetical protein